MEKAELFSLEKEMSSYDFGELNSQKDTAIANIASAQSAADIKTEICNIWGKISKFVKWAEYIPGVGKFITILANLLDSLCG